VVALLTVPVLVLGVIVTGSGPHSGDEDAAYRFALDPAFISRFHSASVWLYLAGVVALVLVLRRRAAPAGARRAVEVLLVVTLLQGLIGYVQYFTGLPAVLVAMHMLGASLLAIAQVYQLFSMRERAAGSPVAG
jgi:cytochrome c oxidase assembly protein subunit 15